MTQDYTKDFVYDRKNVRLYLQIKSGFASSFGPDMRWIFNYFHIFLLLHWTVAKIKRLKQIWADLYTDGTPRLTFQLHLSLSLHHSHNKHSFPPKHNLSHIQTFHKLRNETSRYSLGQTRRITNQRGDTYIMSGWVCRVFPWFLEGVDAVNLFVRLINLPVLETTSADKQWPMAQTRFLNWNYCLIAALEIFFQFIFSNRCP